jgi:hypothetical protein
MKREKNLKGAKGRTEIWEMIKKKLTWLSAGDSYPPKADGSSILLPATGKSSTKVGLFFY